MKGSMPGPAPLFMWLKFALLSVSALSPISSHAREATTKKGNTMMMSIHGGQVDECRKQFTFIKKKKERKQEQQQLCAFSTRKKKISYSFLKFILHKSFKMFFI